MDAYDGLFFELSVPGRVGYSLPEADVPEADPARLLPAAHLRRTPAALPEVSEFDAVRHYTRLSRMNYGVDTHFYPLGSCTMKYNPKLNEDMARLPGFARLHPLTPEDAEAIREMFEEDDKVPVAEHRAVAFVTAANALEGRDPAPEVAKVVASLEEDRAKRLGQMYDEARVTMTNSGLTPKEREILESLDKNAKSLEQHVKQAIELAATRKNDDAAQVLVNEVDPNIQRTLFELNMLIDAQKKAAEDATKTAIVTGDRMALTVSFHRFPTFIEARKAFRARPCIYVQTDREENLLRIGECDDLWARYRGGTAYTLDAGNLYFVADAPRVFGRFR